MYDYYIDKKKQMWNSSPKEISPCIVTTSIDSEHLSYFMKYLLDYPIF